jgi:hypothetical protein
MAPHYTDTLEDAFPLLRQKRQLEEEMAAATAAAAESSIAVSDTQVQHPSVNFVPVSRVEFIKAEKPKKRFMTMNDLPQEDMFGNLHEPSAKTEAADDVAVAPYAGTGRRLKDGMPFMYTAFYDGHELTLAVVGCAIVMVVLGLRQMIALSSLHKHVRQLREVVEQQHRELHVHVQRRNEQHYYGRHNSNVNGNGGHHYGGMLHVPPRFA